MDIKAFMGAALLASGLTLTACSSAATPTATTTPAAAMTQAAQGSSTSSAQTGTFAGLNDKHVAGTVSITNGQIVLAGFSSDQGPDLHIYLSNGTDESAIAAGKELGNIAYDKASQTFTLNGTDASQYTTVAIHCDKAKATFGAATLS